MRKIVKEMRAQAIVLDAGQAIRPLPKSAFNKGKWIGVERLVTRIHWHTDSVVRKNQKEKQKPKGGEVVYPKGGDRGTTITEPPIDPTPPLPPPSGRNEVRLKFTVPKGKVSGPMGVMNLLQSNFKALQIELLATGGEMSEQDYEDKIKEAFVQLGIDLGE